ncbi:unnamed protein product [Acanthoscelides obtectus]|uniref:Uncharacterized protein n=1 Tax=Acanthoscelides obtectus TaxID=200917 RepID=A0A9P0K8A4_ACAOB|nr:unnamed protein product [Acanthoscelides obtectus]CAK1622885.1 hypothetical protein AOBTE_LOCUS1708 [Acanthoscelides obtectus]
MPLISRFKIRLLFFFVSYR